MSKRYSQIKAMFAITKASLISLIHNPSAVVFSIIFPVIFIAIFGLLGNGGSTYDIYLDSSTDKSAPIYSLFEQIKPLKQVEYENYNEAYEALESGQIDAIVKITQTNGKSEIDLTTSEASVTNGSIVTSILKSLVTDVNLATNEITERATLQTTSIAGREYKQIDFILPGQLGFALLNSGIFGSAFVLLSLKETLVLKRFFATPIKRINILLAEGLSRLIFSTFQAILIIAIGYFFFDFTLVHGVWTAIEMIIIAMAGLIVFLGMGLMISSISRDENSVAPIANLFTLPQFLLGGVFFPVDVFPTWLQPIGHLMPLTHLNEAMRKIAFEGASFSEVGTHLLVLLIWAIVVYVVTSRMFKWDK